MNYSKEYETKVSIKKDGVTKEYLVTYFSLLNKKIILGLFEGDLIIELNEEDKVFKNGKQLKFKL